MHKASLLELKYRLRNLENSQNENEGVRRKLERQIRNKKKGN